MPPSENLGRYRLLDPIGRGAMGVVFAGEHTALRRPVAIKVLHAHLVGDGVMARRMVDEAHTIASLHHPGIVEVLDIGATSDGRTFVVMELLAGEPLSTRLERGRLPEERAVAFARQLASALEVAHAAGVIHRDLKPENMFVVPDPDVPGGERIKVLDFGIAKRVVDGGEKTRTGIVLGTPAYMAPEQSAGSEQIDARIDVYALGVVIYRMVTGVMPFAGNNTDELAVEHAFCAPAPVASLAPVSAGLSAIIERCLAKRPDDRFATMAQLAEALAQLDTAHAPPAWADGEIVIDAGLHEELTDPGDVLTTLPVPTLTPLTARVGDDEPTGAVAPSAAAIAAAIATDSRVAIATTTGRMSAVRRRPPAWLWPVAALAAAGLGLVAAVLVRAPLQHRSTADPAAAAASPPTSRPTSPRLDEPHLRGVASARSQSPPSERLPALAPTPRPARSPGRLREHLRERVSVRTSEPARSSPSPSSKARNRRAPDDDKDARPTPPPRPTPPAPRAEPTPTPPASKERSFATVQPPTLY